MSQDIAAVFQGSGLIPDIVDSAPNDLIQVKYPSGKSVEPGIELEPVQVKDEPEVKWKTNDGDLYTLHMSDPDAPSQFAPINHWLVVNIPGNRVSEGRTLTEYRGSRPRQNTGLHRYAFLVYKQKGKLDVSDSDLPAADRRSFKIREFASRHDLGNPVAGNFYRAQFDDYVASVTQEQAPK